ncbi:ankyrin [Ascodesmis nigricans]|uniref:Ankyrin n=1 Tax=Ascodesmis nigricans TaxID=341454 RepID=A0A4S2MMB7_9PEZI|nr:ankyrin [Ascodesmis nigricans]
MARVRQTPRSDNYAGIFKRSITRGDSFVPPPATRLRISNGSSDSSAPAASLDQLASLPTSLPATPTAPKDFLKHVGGNPQVPVRELLQPYIEHENVLRAYLAQKPDHEFVASNTVNLVNVFDDDNAGFLKVRARELEKESIQEKERYIIPLTPEERKISGEPALVQSLDEFRKNFAIFTEGSLANLDWSNIVVAGSAVLTPLLPVPEEYAATKRALRNYYHEKLAPASDIDIFIYGLDSDEEAIKKMESIEKIIKDNLLWETTAIRTRNTVTICSQYPNRHIQIVLRLYKSISQILTGFDVNCSCFAYDGANVWGNPRSLAACITQCNDIDIRRRSPSYENRLAKYSHKRGFEVYFSDLDRSRVDPTIFERSFHRLQGLARLLVLESLPTEAERGQYQIQRRKEMGRPVKELPTHIYDMRDKKEGGWSMEIPEWDEGEELSDYQRFSIPYGSVFYAKKLEKMFFKKDLTLNAEWNERNRPPYRHVKLHRHPVFFGDVKDIVEDCCGYCPEPTTEEELEVAKKENGFYVHGRLKFLHYRESDAGRQEVGSFYPLNPSEFSQMAYIGATERLCQAIVDNDASYVQSWVKQEGTDINSRDHCGRTPLHLSCLSTSTDINIINCLIDNGARLVARLQDGRTALHLAAARGRLDIVNALMRKSAEHELEKVERESKKLALKDEQKEGRLMIGEEPDGDVEMRDAVEGSLVAEPSTVDGDDNDKEETETEPDDESSADDFASIHMSEAGSMLRAPSMASDNYVNVPPPTEDEAKQEEVPENEDLDGEDQDDIYDVNVEDWDWGMSPLHHALINSHPDVVETLVSDYGADPRKPVKIFQQHAYERRRSPSGALLTLSMALNLQTPEERAEMVRTLLKSGASSGQATVFHGRKTSAFHFLVTHGSQALLDIVFDLDGPIAKSVINNINCNPHNLFGVSPLVTAMEQSIDLANYLLSHGARGKVVMQDILRVVRKSSERAVLSRLYRPEYVMMKRVQEPLLVAMYNRFPVEFLEKLISAGGNVNTADPESLPFLFGEYRCILPINGRLLLDYVRQRIHEAEHYLTEEDAIIEKEKTSLETPPCVIPESVLSEYTHGSYMRLLAERYRDQENKRRESKIQYHEGQKKNHEKRLSKFTLKHDAVERELKLFREYEQLLMKHGAKTYHETYPEQLKQYLAHQEEVKRTAGQQYQPLFPHTYSRHHDTGNDETDKFEVPFQADHRDRFGDVDPEAQKKVQEGYKKLFSAVWDNDLATIKALTSGLTGTGEDKIPGLLVTASTDGMNTLAVALLRGHYDLIEPLVQIAQAQYDGGQKKKLGRYGRDETESEDEDSSCGSDEVSEVEDEGPAIYTDEDFVMEHGDEPVGLMPKCSVDPWTFISSPAALPPVELVSTDIYDEMLSFRRYPLNVSPVITHSLPQCQTGSLMLQSGALSFAIIQNDIALFRKFVHLAKTLPSDESDSLIDIARKRLGCDPTPSGRNLEQSPSILGLAIRLNRTAILEIFMQELTFGIFYDECDEPDEDERKRKFQKYYQGLTIRGGKNKDWVNSSSRKQDTKPSEHIWKVAHIAAQSAAMESMQWLMSGNPWRCLNEFKEANPDTREARILSAQGDKLESVLYTNLGLNPQLHAHMTVLGWRARAHSQKSAEMLRFLASKSSIREAKDSNGLTPALFAVRNGHPDAVKLLASMGADFSVRDKHGRNILHLLLVTHDRSGINSRCLLSRAKRILSYIPRDIVVSCTTQRTFGFLRTPLSHWLHQADCHLWAVITELLEPYFPENHEDLLIPDSEGNSPVHLAFLRNWHDLARYFITRVPHAIHMENANGRTPLEIAYTQFLTSLIAPYGLLSVKIPTQVNIEGSMALKEVGTFKFEGKEAEDEDDDKENPHQALVNKLEENVEKTYQLAWELRMQAKGTKRKLAALHEANELVRRIVVGAHLADAKYADVDVFAMGGSTYVNHEM